MSTLICGSLAFDTIMDFEGRFAEQILPAQLHILNVSFLVPSLRRDFGGCAGNIAYAMKQLGGQPLPMATLGRDGATYLERLKQLDIATNFVRQIDDEYTAQAMIMTDRDNNQITAFHPGAMNHDHLNAVPTDGSIGLGIVAPESHAGMRLHARQFVAAGIPFVFDPGQGLPMFDGRDLARFIEQAPDAGAQPDLARGQQLGVLARLGLVQGEDEVVERRVLLGVGAELLAAPDRDHEVLAVLVRGGDDAHVDLRDQRIERQGTRPRRFLQRRPEDRFKADRGGMPGNRHRSLDRPGEGGSPVDLAWSLLKF